ncbi:M48 family metalloprotease [Catellatospora chokoriensis]|uniref:Peptidase M48 domain-containing protein n=1 Tax=Catellatospora chokoriensis TaxID=310353 RepID=A0A8J3KE52_9ACTN|nr:M48 family metalloprotease [Catellatospora chokoriensis]GIF94279.1 hypothetical protein Cch02nite_77230 [Catellatospora chokoriensis]
MNTDIQNPDTAAVRLPSDLTVRFFVLLLLILGSTASIYGHMWLVLAGGENEQCPSVDDIARVTGINAITAEQLRGSTLMLLACGRPFTQGLLQAALAGTALVLVTAWVAYRLLPYWKMRYDSRLRDLVRQRLTLRRPRRSGLVPVEQSRHAEAITRLQALAGQLGLDPPPQFLVSRYASGELVFGTRNTAYVKLSDRLLDKRSTLAPAFDAVVLHELAHVRNRDNRATYLTVTLFRSFVGLALLPYVLVVLLPRAQAGAAGVRIGGLRSASTDLHVVLAVAILTGLVVLTRAALLRAREINADLTAARHDPHGCLRTVFDPAAAAGGRNASEPVRAGRRWRRPGWLSNHPTPRQRLRALDDPGTVGAVDAVQLFVAGVAVSALTANVTLLAWHAMVASPLGRGLPSVFLVILLVAVVNAFSAGVIAWFATTAMWRQQLSSDHARTSRALGYSVVMAAGLLVGEPLSMTYANAGVWAVFGGVGNRPLVGSAMAALTLVAVMAMVFVWSGENAAVLLARVRHSHRSASVASTVVAALGVLPVLTLWWLMHLQDMIATVHLGSRELAEQMGAAYWDGPAGPWLQAVYLPVQLLAAVPGAGAVIVACCLFTTVASLWRRLPGRLDRQADAPARVGAVAGWGLGWAAVVIGGALLFTVWLQARFDDLNAVPRADLISYLCDALVALAAVGGAAAALCVRDRRATVKLVASTVTAGVVSLFAPVFVLAGACGISGVAACAGRVPADYAGVIYGYAAPRLLVKTLLLAMFAIAVSAGAARLRRHFAGAQHPVPPAVAAPPGVASRVTAATALLFLGATLAMWTYYGAVFLAG